MTTIDQENEIANDSLSLLRQKIQEKKEIEENRRIEEFASVTPVLELVDVPEVTIPHTATFSLERHQQLCERLEALYHNYLVSKNTLPKEVKELAVGIEQLLDEVMTCRL